MAPTSSCSACGAPIIWACTEDGIRIKLDANELPITGYTAPAIYRVIDYGSQPWTVKRDTNGHTVHTCYQVTV